MGKFVLIVLAIVWTLESIISQKNILASAVDSSRLDHGQAWKCADVIQNRKWILLK